MDPYEENDNNNLCKMPRYQYVCVNNLNLTRNLMPQLTRNLQEQYIARKQSYLIYVNPMNLFPIQSEINALKVSKIIESIEDNLLGSMNKKNHSICADQDAGILVAYDNVTTKMYIIDGHHRYAACRLMNQSIYVHVVQGTPVDILNELNNIEGIVHRSIDQ
jgi:hypothetical protein